MRANNDLEIWQVLGVARVIEIMEKTRPDGSLMFCGAFISDVMGLGKTFQATIFILEVCLVLLKKEF
jgi:SNF2 family DNA or RNA helicase